MRKIIAIKNEVPEILAALCNHPECPDWLKTDIWDCVQERTRGDISFSANYWRSQLEMIGDTRDGNEIRYPHAYRQTEVIQ